MRVKCGGVRKEGRVESEGGRVERETVKEEKEDGK